MNRIVTMTGSALAAMLAGCTTSLQSTQASSASPVEGFTYNLPRLLYDVEVTRVLSKCPAAADAQVEFDISAKATGRLVPGEPIAIDYTTLGDALKTTDFAVEVNPQTGMIKTVNLTVDDRTADVISEGAKAVVGIGKIALGLPQGGGTAAGPRVIASYLACSKTAEEKLKKLPGLEAAVKTAGGTLKKATKAVSDFDADHKEPNRSNAVTAEAAKLASAQRAAQEASDATAKALAEARSSFTLVSSFTVDPQGPVYQQTDRLADAQKSSVKPSDLLELRTQADAEVLAIPLGPKLAIGAAEFEQAHYVGGDPTAATRALASTLADARRKDFEDAIAVLARADVLLASEALAPQSLSGAKIPSAGTCGTRTARCGIFYRTRAPARTRICRFTLSDGVPTATTCLSRSAGWEGLLFSEDRSIPQFGQLASLGLRNGPFANNALSAEFGDDGTLVKFGYKKQRAEALAAAQSINSVLGAATDLISYSRGQQLNALAYQKKVNDARAALATSALPAQPSEVTQVENATALIDAQRKQVEAQIELKKKQDELNALTTPSSTPQ